MYAFDVHCNAYFPLFILLYGAHALNPPNYNMLGHSALTLSTAVWFIACNTCHGAFS